MSEEKKIIELTDEELEKVSGGDIDINPLGLKQGDRVYFYYDIIDNWMWGEFMYYYDGVYRVKWDDTAIIYAGGKASFTLEADEAEIPESYIKFN